MGPTPQTEAGEEHESLIDSDGWEKIDFSDIGSTKNPIEAFNRIRTNSEAAHRLGQIFSEIGISEENLDNLDFMPSDLDRFNGSFHILRHGEDEYGTILASMIVIDNDIQKNDEKNPPVCIPDA
jgi:hypothetical protein